MSSSDYISLSRLKRRKQALIRRFFEVVEKHRIQRSLSRKDFCIRCGFQPGTYRGLICRDNALSLEMIVKCSLGLGIPISQLFREAEASLDHKGSKEDDVLSREN